MSVLGRRKSVTKKCDLKSSERFANENLKRQIYKRNAIDICIYEEICINM